MRRTRIRWLAAVLVSTSFHVSVVLAAVFTGGSFRSQPFLSIAHSPGGAIVLNASMADPDPPAPLPEVQMRLPEVRVLLDDFVASEECTCRQAKSDAKPRTPEEKARTAEWLRRPVAAAAPRTRSIAAESEPKHRPSLLADAIPPPPRRDRPPQIDTLATGVHALPVSSVVGSGDTQPPRLSYENRPPPYPPEAFAQGWEGIVVLRVHIAADGRVSRVEVVQPSGHGVLDAAAADAARSWRFEPAYRGSVPVASTARQDVRFRLRRPPDGG